MLYNDTAGTEIYTLSLHDALPISGRPKISSKRFIRDGFEEAQAPWRWDENTSELEIPAIDDCAHGQITSVVGMEIIPRQLSERAVRQKLRQHVARRRVESDRVKILHAIKEHGAENESVEDDATGVMPRAVVAQVIAADAQCRS